jgi:hypothetical protein
MESEIALVSRQNFDTLEVSHTPCVAALGYALDILMDKNLKNMAAEAMPSVGGDRDFSKELWKQLRR